MSWLYETIIVRWMNQRLARELIFLVLAVICFIGAPAIFADTIFADTNTPTVPLTDSNSPPVALAAASNSPSSLAGAIFMNSSSAPAATGASTVGQAGMAGATNGTFLLQTNLLTPVDPFVQKLETARYLRKVRQTKDVGPLLVSLLDNGVPEQIQKSALLELAALAQDEDDLPRAQQICAQYMKHWPDDTRIPEVLLRQGQVFRQMGLHNLALTKFYSVMTAALTLKNDRLDYYAHLVVQAQIEIAETHYSLGKYAEAAEYFSRLFKQDNPEINKPQILYRLVRCNSNTTNYEEAVAGAQDYLAHYADAPEEPEVRFHLASALKQLGHDNESLQQVLTLLREQSVHAAGHPEVWAYWQQRAGNLIANQFYRDGDYPRALNIYTSLSQLDASPQWQLPVWYQIGMTYERLLQPQKATEIYSQIINREKELGTNAPPSLLSIVEMARWRAGFIQWQNNAENVNLRLAGTNAVFTANDAKPAPNHE
jgi:tetratricopeptide (TPR) repeat protein